MFGKRHLKFFVAFAFTYAISTLAANARPQEAPRMWEVTGDIPGVGPTKFHILGITHDGFDIEYDPYLARVIVPTFNNARVLWHENAAFFAAQVPQCKAPLTGTAELELVRTLRSKVEKRFYNSFPQGDKSQFDASTLEDIKFSNELFAKRLAADLSEFGLVVQLRSLRLNNREASPQDVPRPRKPNQVAQRGSITGFLVSQRPTIAQSSIDTPEEIFEAYCDMPERAEYLKAQMEFWDSGASETISTDEMQSLNTQLTLALRTNSAPEVFKREFSVAQGMTWLCQRNKNWAKKMTEENNNGAFYSLGLAHLVQTERGPDCPDLKELLRRRGMTVKLVE